MLASRVIVSSGMAVSMALFAQGAATSPKSGWEELSAMACLIGVLGYLVMKMLPDLQKRFSDQATANTAALKAQSDVFAATMKDAQVQFTTTLDKIHERWADATKATNEELARMREHCARVHGIESR